MSDQVGRYASLDALRGITIVAMVLVNNPGSWAYTYAPMRHAKWHGWTLTDLIFPFFLFIVGVSAAISISRQQAQGKLASAIIQQAFVRSTKLVLLGLVLALFYYNFSDPSYNWWQSRLLEIRIPGVLQRIGVVFFITVILTLWLRTGGLIVFALILLVSYTLLMEFVPYTTASGEQFSGQWLFGNSLAAWLDHTVLGPEHVYHRFAQPFAFDPEGILTTIPAVATCLSGVAVSRYLQSPASTIRKTRMMLGCALVMVIAAYLLSPMVPFNKPLWTPSYVLLTSGLATLALVGLWWLVDVAGYRRWAQLFIICGVNSIAFYVLAGVLARIFIMVPVESSSLHGFIYTQLFMPLFGPLNGSLAFAASFLVISFLPIWWMYQKNIIWKV